VQEAKALRRRLPMRVKTHFAPLIAAASLLGSRSYAQDMAKADRETDAERCVSVNLIDRTAVVDDRNILFYMRDDRVYRNILPHRCPDLAFEERFMYRRSLGQLCDVDSITVLGHIGFGLRMGASCRLGMFHPITEQEAEDLKSFAGTRSRDR
jgi:hypothetical protein